MFLEGPFDGFFRTTWRDKKECEQFSVAGSEGSGASDFLYLQAVLFRTGSIVWAHVPAVVAAGNSKKILTVGLIDPERWFEDP